MRLWAGVKQRVPVFRDSSRVCSERGIRFVRFCGHDGGIDARPGTGYQSGITQTSTGRNRKGKYDAGSTGNPSRRCHHSKSRHTIAVGKATGIVTAHYKRGRVAMKDLPGRRRMRRARPTRPTGGRSVNLCRVVKS